MIDLYLGHPPELVDRAVVLPDGHFVQLDDLVFLQHGLGPRYARVQTQDYRRHRALSYAYLAGAATTYTLITDIDEPVDLGSLDDLMHRDADLTACLSDALAHRLDAAPAPQQVGLALIRAGAEGLQAGDELGAHRVVKWSLQYERRALWICCNRQLAFSKSSSNWPALGL